MHLSAFMALRYHRPWNNHTFQQIPLKCIYPRKGWSIFRLLLCSGRFLSARQPNRCYFSVRAVTLSFVMKFCSPCFSSFNPSCPFLSTTHIYCRFTIHSEQMCVNTSRFLTFGRQDSFTVRCFKCTVIFAILESTVVLPSVE